MTRVCSQDEQEDEWQEADVPEPRNRLMTHELDTYSFAYTAASMKFHDFMRLAQYVRDEGLDIDRQKPDPDHIMRRDNRRTNTREFRELLKRYQKMTPAQRHLITEVDIPSQRQLAMVGICKLYAFVRDFILETVREKYLGLDYQLTDGDFQSFFNRKRDMHTELDEFSESTIRKARQVTWRMLEQAGLIESTKNRRILPQYVQPRVAEVIREDDPQLLKLFLLSDHEIQALNV